MIYSCATEPCQQHKNYTILDEFTRSDILSRKLFLNYSLAPNNFTQNVKLSNSEELFKTSVFEFMASPVHRLNAHD